MRSVSCFFLLVSTVSCGASAAAKGVRIYSQATQVVACEDLGRVSGHASGWGARFRANAEDDAREAALKLGADSLVVTYYQSGIFGHDIGAEAYRCIGGAKLATTPARTATPLVTTAARAEQRAA